MGPMLLELTSGATSTHHGYSDYVKLERQWMTEVAGKDMSVADVRPPHAVEESFIAFLEWLVTDGPRARSFGSVVVSASGYMTKLEMTDWTKKPRVKAFIKEIGVSGGAETVPCTPVTTLMVQRMAASCDVALWLLAGLLPGAGAGSLGYRTGRRGARGRGNGRAAWHAR